MISVFFACARKRFTVGHCEICGKIKWTVIRRKTPILFHDCHIYIISSFSNYIKYVPFYRGGIQRQSQLMQQINKPLDVITVMVIDMNYVISNDDK